MTDRRTPRGRGWAIIAVPVLLLGSVPAPAIAADPTAQGDPSARTLLEIYQERYRREAQALALSLDVIDAEIRKRLLSPEPGALWDAVSYATTRDAPVRKTYKNLIELGKRYNEWAVKFGLPSTFAVQARDVLGSRRREAIRPLLLPLLGEAGRAAWDDPDRDADDWRDARSARLYEFLMLLSMMSGEANEDPALLAWIRHEVGAKLIVGWKGRHARRLTFLHGCYSFETVGLPDPTGTPARVRAVLEVFSPRAGNEAESGLLKDDFLVALLHLLARGVAGDVGADWFSLGGRSTPIFTALQPQLDGGGFRALGDRPGPRVRDLVDEAEKSLDPESARAVREGVFWLQVGGIDDTGRPRLPAVPWTSDVVAGVAARGETIASPPAISPAPVAAPPPASEGDLGPFPPESAWRRTCEWVAGLRIRPIPDRESGSSRVSVENRTSWRIAFGAEELALVLTRTQLTGPQGANWLAADPRASASEADLRIVVVGVEPARAITIEIRRGGDLLGKRRILVNGPWPAWFALGPDWGRWDVLSAAFALAGIAVALATAWYVSPAGGRTGRRFGVKGGLAVAALSLALWPLLRPGAAPRPAPGRGERIVFEVPSGREIPGPMKDFTAAVCAGTCRELWWRSVETEAVDLSAPRDVHSPPTSSTEAERAVPDGVLDLLYEIRSSTWRGGRRSSVLGQGRVRDATTGSIRAMLDREDVTPDDEPTLPPALLDGPEPGVTLTVVVHDGDHGLLAPPRLPTTGKDRPPVVAIWLPTPTRDSRDGAGLDARSRFARLAEGGAAAISPLRGLGPDVAESFDAMPNGITIATLDDSGRSPQDLTTLRAAMWDFSPPTVFDPFAGAAGGLAAKTYHEIRPATSRTALRRSVGVGDLLWSSAALAVLALFFWSTLPGMSARSCGRTIAFVFAMTASVALATTGAVALATRRCEVWALGQRVASAGRSASAEVAGAAALASALALGAWALERRLGSKYGNEVRDATTLFARPSSPALPTGLRGGAGLLLLAAALTFWASEPVSVGGAWPWLLPASERSCLYAGLGMWALGIASLLPGRDRPSSPPAMRSGALRS